jgi:hypothetical protein
MRYAGQWEAQGVIDDFRNALPSHRLTDQGQSALRVPTREPF